MNPIVRMIRETDLSSGFVYNYLQEREERERVMIEILNNNWTSPDAGSRCFGSAVSESFPANSQVNDRISAGVTLAVN